MTNFSKVFDKYKRTKNENTLPSNLIPLEIERWEKYRELVTKRDFKTLKRDKDQFIEYLKGDTLPMSRVYESNKHRTIELNPLFDKQNRTFPLWENISIVAHHIGDSYEYTSARAGLRAAVKDLIETLKALDLNKLDREVKEFDRKLQNKRSFVTYKAIVSRRLLKHYPMP